MTPIIISSMSIGIGMHVEYVAAWMSPVWESAPREHKTGLMYEVRY